MQPGRCSVDFTKISRWPCLTSGGTVEESWARMGSDLLKNSSCYPSSYMLTDKTGEEERGMTVFSIWMRSKGL